MARPGTAWRRPLARPAIRFSPVEFGSECHRADSTAVLIRADNPPSEPVAHGAALDTVANPAAARIAVTRGWRVTARRERAVLWGKPAGQSQAQNQNQGQGGGERGGRGRDPDRKKRSREISRYPTERRGPVGPPNVKRAQQVPASSAAEHYAIARAAARQIASVSSTSLGPWAIET